MENVKVYVCKESDGSYSCYIDEKSNLPYSLVGEGKNVKEAIEEWERAYLEMKALFEQEGKKFKEAVFSFTYDVPSFLSYYGGIITFKGLSKITGISAQAENQVHEF